MSNQELDFALIEAASTGNIADLKRLLHEGANINATNGDGASALMQAANGGHFDVVEYLLLKRAAVNMMADFGETALCNACINGKADISKLLLIAGADVNVQTFDRAASPLMLAASIDVFELLIEFGANMNVRDKAGATVLMQVAEDGNYEKAKILVSKGAERWALNDEGKSALQIAQESGHQDIVNLIQSHE